MYRYFATLLLMSCSAIVLAGSKSVIINGSFDAGEDGWVTCSGTTGTSELKNTASGGAALVLSGGACRYQEFDVVPLLSYRLECNAKSTDYSSVILTFMNSSYQNLARDISNVDNEEYEAKVIQLVAPTGSTIGAVTLYSDGGGQFDNCIVVALEQEADMVSSKTPLLKNGNFEASDDQWIRCSGSAGSVKTSAEAAEGNKSLRIDGGGCLYQEFVIAQGKKYQLDCLSKADGYTSAALTLMNQSHTKLDSNTVEISGTEFKHYYAKVTAPINSSVGVVTLYSEGGGLFDDCSVTEQ